jgi:hypothetical protein
MRQGFLSRGILVAGYLTGLLSLSIRTIVNSSYFSAKNNPGLNFIRESLVTAKRYYRKCKQ